MPAPKEPTTADPLAWAKAYAKRGWRVLPIKPGEKRPPMAAWQEAATTDEATIDAWWTQLYKGHGIGIATGKGSGIFVLDVDVSEDKAGDETLNALLDQFGGLEDGPMAYTPSGGYHVYFRLPEGVEVRNDAGRRLGPGLDIRGEGGQVVAPPTSREEGGYEWDGDSFELPVPEAPRWLLERVVAKPAPEGKENLDAKAPQGKENVASTPRLAEADSPADRFNASTDWPTLLAGDGWTLSGRSEDGYEEWVRPGKDARKGASATVGWNGLDILRVFTTSIDWLPEGAYSRFQYLALRDHGGDYSAAAKAVVRAEGGGSDGYLDALLAAQPAPTALEAGEVQVGPNETGWEPVDIAVVLADDYEPPRPELLERNDGAFLLYRGRINALYGESGSGKSWVAMAACAQVMAEGRTALYVDFEDHVGSVASRMMALGVTRDQLMRQFLYINPQVAWSGFAAMQLRELIEAYDVDIVVVDSTGEAMAIDGAEPNSDDDTARWFRQVPRFLANLGPAVLLLDHVPKASDAPKGFAIGSQRKRAAIDGASYRVEVGMAPAKGLRGHLKLITAKDRGGHYQHGHKVAEVYIEDSQGGIDVTITPPYDGPPTEAMRKISEWLKGEGWQSKTKIRSGVEKVENAVVSKALDALVEHGFAEKREREGRGGGTEYHHLVDFTGPMDLVMGAGKKVNPYPVRNPSGEVADELDARPRNPSGARRADGFETASSGLVAGGAQEGNPSGRVQPVREEVNLPSHIEDRDLI